MAEELASTLAEPEVVYKDNPQQARRIEELEAEKEAEKKQYEGQIAELKASSDVDKDAKIRQLEAIR